MTDLDTRADCIRTLIEACRGKVNNVSAIC
jgi:hypothetical protein